MRLIFELKEETLYMDRESQIKAIRKTFDDNKKPLEKHHSKSNVHAVEVFPIFPDFKVISFFYVVYKSFISLIYHGPFCL